nr:DUF6705 family protein [Mucilaginibacter sp.]
MTTFCLKAQPQRKYYTEVNLNKFVGEWVYTNGSTIFKITLMKEKFFVKGADLYMDMIRGNYTLTKDGKVIQSSSKDTTIRSGHLVDKNKSLKAITFSFLDLGRDSKSCKVLFELLEGDSNKAKWTLSNTEHIVVGNEHFDPTFSVPANMVLTKVN